MCEIYNENILDLLQHDAKERKPLNIREDPKFGNYVAGATQNEIHSIGEALREIHYGLTHRHVAATNINEGSSRSHCIFSLTLVAPEGDDAVPSKLTFVDLAGSERQSKTGAVGATLKEANNINRSLVTLGSVIRGLISRSEGKNNHIPYRDSKLTFLLRDSLGGNCRTWIVGTVSPSFSNSWETFSTIRFCHGSKMVKCKPIKNEAELKDVEQMRREIERLKRENAALRESHVPEDVQKEYERLKSRVRHLEFVVFAKMDQENGFRQDLKLRGEEIECYRMKVEELERTKQELGVAIQALQRQNAELQRGDRTDAGVAALREEADRWKALYMEHPDVKVLRAENQLLRNKLDAVKPSEEQTEEIQRLNEEMINQTAILSRDVRLLSAANERLETENRALKENATESVVNEFRRKMNELDREIVELRAGMQDRERQIEELQADNEQLVALYDQQKQTLARYSRKSVRELKEEVLAPAGAGN